jgi:glycosyltransferase involved in cell wall biosynthesis
MQAPANRPLRIAVWHNLPAGGGKRALFYHVRGLLERGHHIEAWRPPSVSAEYLPLGDMIAEHIVPLAWDDTQQRTGLARVREEGEMQHAVEQHCRQCAEQIDQGGFDVVFANSCRLVRVPPLARYVTIPSVLYLQEPFRTHYEALPDPPWAAPPWPQQWWRLASLLSLAKDTIKTYGLRVAVREETRNVRAFQTVLANSLFSRESILRAYGVEARVCYLGVDSALFVARGRPREDFVVGLGAFSPEKNIESVIEALALLPDPRPRLVWVGSVVQQRYLGRLQGLARVRNVMFEPRVAIDDDELVDVLNRAALMVYAPRLEPFGLATIEANACATPVVAIAEGGVRETVEHGVNGLLVAHSSDLAGAVQRLVQDKAYARLLGEQGARLARERWSLASAAERIERALVNAAAPVDERMFA